MSLEERRVVIVGKTGNGKSSTINTIVGTSVCKASASAGSVTKECQLVEETVLGKNLILVDTPGIFDTESTNADTMKEIAKIIGLTSPGFHAFVVVIRIGRFTTEEIRCIEILAQLFGPELYKRAVVLFTGVDNLKADGSTFEKYLRDDITQDLKSFLHACGDRVVAFNNRDQDDREQVARLMDIIDKIIIANDNSHYTHKAFEKAKRLMEKEENRRIQKNRSRSQAEVRQEIRQDIEKENTLGKQIIQTLIDTVVIPIVKALAETVVGAAKQEIGKRCTLS